MAEDPAFAIGPRINARGRLDEAITGLRFLLSEHQDETNELAEFLDAENTERKRIESEMRDTAVTKAGAQVEEGAAAVVVWLPDGHAGVHGIVAS